MLTPSVVTESQTSAWGVNNEGIYTSVMVLDGEAYVCGINKDGSVKKEKYKIGEGYQRTTKRFENPGKLNATPDEIIQWFKDEVVKHHMSKELTKHMRTKTTRTRNGKKEKVTERKLKGKNIIIIDDEEVDILNYIYKGRLNDTEKPAKKVTEKSDTIKTEQTDSQTTT